MTDTSKDLLPCPFCGGEANFSEGVQLGFSTFKDMTAIACKECGRGEGFVFKTKDAAANSWNTRTPDLTAAAEAMAEALKEANSAVNNAYEMAYAEWNNHDRRGAKLGDKIGDWRAKQKDALAQYNAMLAEREKSYD